MNWYKLIKTASPIKFDSINDSSAWDRMGIDYQLVGHPHDRNHEGNILDEHQMIMWVYENGRFLEQDVSKLADIYDSHYIVWPNLPLDRMWRGRTEIKKGRPTRVLVYMPDSVVGRRGIIPTSLDRQLHRKWGEDIEIVL